MTALLVYNIEAASPSMIWSLDRHCKDRVPDGTSAIDLERSHLNETLVGSEEGLFASLQKFFEGGPKPPAKQAEKPYLRIVVSASAEYFRPEDPDAVGTWDQDRLDVWRKATMDQLRAEHGEDLIYAELHLDEDTPHIHAIVAPTYRKKPRRPGKQKRGETKEQFAARKAAAQAATGERVVGRASHPELSKLGSFQRLRERMAVAVEHLGIEYGEDRNGQANAKTTRQWVKEQAAQIREKQAELSAQQAALSAREAELAEREGLLTRWSVENFKKQKELDEQRVIFAKSQQSLHDKQNSIDAVEALLSDSQKRFETNLAAFRKKQAEIKEREVAIDKREQSLTGKLSYLQGVMRQIRAIITACSERFGLPVPHQLKTLDDINVALKKFEEHKPKPLSAPSPIDDDFSWSSEKPSDETPGGPGF